jgi:hypothetical protein
MPVESRPILKGFVRGARRKGGGGAVLLAMRECRVWRGGALESIITRKLPSRVLLAAAPVATAMAALAAASSHLQGNAVSL